MVVTRGVGEELIVFANGFSDIWRHQLFIVFFLSIFSVLFIKYLVPSKNFILTVEMLSEDW